MSAISTKLVFRWVLFMFALILFQMPARGDSVRVGSDNVHFYFTQDDGIARVCGLATIIALPSGEAVNFSLSFGFTKRRDMTDVYGFTAHAGDVRMRNGKPEGLDEAQIVDADIASAKFNSVGQMRNAPSDDTGDKGILKMTSDPTVARALIAAVTSGRFEILISRATGSSRTYIIEKVPPQESIDKFIACTGA